VGSACFVNTWNIKLFMKADVLVNVHDVENCCRIPAPGMMSTLMYGICILLGQFTAKDELWKTVSLPSSQCYASHGIA